MKKVLILFLIAGIAGYAPTAIFAQPQQSENFRITKSVLDAGGGPSTSANFQLVSAFGQPTPIGVASSTNFLLSAGFFSPIFSVSPLSPIQDLVIMRQPASNNMKLDWSAIAGATLYTIYRDPNPLFTPGPGNLLGTNTSNTYTDVNAVSLPAIKYFYNVTSTAGTVPAAIKLPGDQPVVKHSLESTKAEQSVNDPVAKQPVQPKQGHKTAAGRQN
jgi:hypothetical protein